MIEVSVMYHMYQLMKFLSQTIMRIPGRAFVLSRQIIRRCVMIFVRPLFAGIGARVHLDPFGDYSYSKIYLGSDVFVGSGIVMRSGPKGSIQIGSHVMIGPNVSFHSGNHSTSYIGRFMSSVGEDEKLPGDENGIVVEDDVWIGSRAVILDGVKIRRGAVVAAGAVVTGNVPPYVVVGGVPAKIIKFRFNLESILMHEKQLYQSDQRLGVDEIRKNCQRRRRGADVACE